MRECLYHSELKAIKQAGHTDIQCSDAAINEMETYYMESSGCARYDETNEAKIQNTITLTLSPIRPISKAKVLGKNNSGARC